MSQANGLTSNAHHIAPGDILRLRRTMQSNCLRKQASKKGTIPLHQWIAMEKRSIIPVNSYVIVITYSFFFGKENLTVLYDGSTFTIENVDTGHDFERIVQNEQEKK